MSGLGEDVLLSVFLIAVQAEQVVVRVVEPHPASEWVEAFSGSCGQYRLEIRRPMRPLEDDPQVLMNGRSARGDLRPLKSDLDEVGAAYRFSFQCSPDGETMLLRWVRGLAGEQGHVRYRVGDASFHRGALVEARSEEDDEEAFWYR